MFRRAAHGLISLLRTLPPGQAACQSREIVHSRPRWAGPSPRRSSPDTPLQYAVKIVSTDAKGNATCRCLFCGHGGREEVAIGRNRKRKRTLKQKLVTIPFSHKYRSNRESQNSEACQTLSDTDKELFRNQPNLANALHRRMDSSSDTLTFSIGTSIVDTIIGDMFFRGDEVLDDNCDDESKNGHTVRYSVMCINITRVQLARPDTCTYDSRCCDLLIFCVGRAGASWLPWHCWTSSSRASWLRWQ
jgi:hypothetical protein